MRKLLILIILFLFFTNTTTGQNTDNILVNATVGNIPSPATPEAFGFARFGNIPMNESIGAANITIPIYTIKVNDYKLPIYLSYLFTGLKATERSGMVGVGWSLHAGGLIQREKRGFAADEDGTYGYIGQYIGQNYVIPFIQNTQNNDDKIRTLEMAYSSNNMETQPGDTEPDRFSILMEGLSGAYFYSAYREPVFTPQKNYILSDFFAQNDSILLTDDNGINYNFSKTNTISNEIHVINSVGNDSWTMKYKNEWWITNIQLPNTNKTIKFEYYDTVNGVVPFYKTLAYSEYQNRYLGGNVGQNSPLSGKCFNYSYHSNDIYNEDVSFKNNRVFIKRIDYDEGYVLFDIQKATINIFKPDFYLHKIEVYNKNNNLLEKYIFEYDDTTSKYMLLTKIRKYDKAGNEVPFYTFSYNDPPQRDINLKSQDAWGYYNGKNTQLSDRLLTGDRRPDFDKTKMCSMDTLFYPTGGFTKFNYEQNDTYYNTLSCSERLSGGTLIKKDSIKLYYQPGAGGADGNGETDNSDGNWIFEPTEAVIDTLGPQNIVYNINGDTGTYYGNWIYRDTIDVQNNDFIYVRMKGKIYEDNYNANHPNAFLTIKYTSSDPNMQCFCDNCPDSLRVPVQRQEVVLTPNEAKKTAAFWIQPHSKIYLEMKFTEFLLGNGFNANIDGVFEVKVADSIPAVVNQKVGGIRLASMIDCTEKNSNKCVTTNYVYKDSVGKSTGKTYKSRLFKRKIYQIHEAFLYSDTGIVGHVDCVIENTVNLSSYPTATPSGSSVFYSEVQKIIDNGETTGRIIKKFKDDYSFNYNNISGSGNDPYNLDLSYNYTGLIRSNLNDNNWKRGKLIETGIQKYSQSTLDYKTVKNTTKFYDSIYPYQSQNSTYHNIAVGIISSRLNYGYNQNGFLLPAGTGDYDKIEYTTKPEIFYLTKQIDKDYKTDGSYITSQTDYIYDPLTGYLKEKTETGPRKNLTTKYYYPGDIDPLVNLLGGTPTPLTSQDISGYELLKAPDDNHPERQNKVSIPIQIEQYDVAGLLAVKRTLFENFGAVLDEQQQPVAGKYVVAPSKIQTMKSDLQLETRLKYLSYDGYGNPVIVQKTDGTKQYYIWGYRHSKLLAVINNYQSFDSTQQSLIEDALALSDNDYTPQNDLDLINKLKELQATFKNKYAQTMTFYTYQPLVGVSSKTDEKGETLLYEYDDQNRLKRIWKYQPHTGPHSKFIKGYILKEYDYHYKD